VYWSLAVEEHFYLVFPLFFALLQRARWPRSRQALILVVVCGVVLAWRIVLIFLLGAEQDRTYVASDTRVDSILAGCILAIWNNPVLDRESIDDKRLAFFWLPLGAAAVLLSIVVREFRFDQTLRYTLQSFGLMPFFIAAVRWSEHWSFRWLNLPVVRYLGLLSYSMYLMHTATLWMFERHVPFSTPGSSLRGRASIEAWKGRALACAGASLATSSRPKSCQNRRESPLRELDFDDGNAVRGDDLLNAFVLRRFARVRIEPRPDPAEHESAFLRPCATRRNVNRRARCECGIAVDEDQNQALRRLVT
jgi:peptidoglycan/LPS O-acetylase OafA/YrhL